MLSEGRQITNATQSIFGFTANYKNLLQETCLLFGYTLITGNCQNTADSCISQQRALFSPLLFRSLL